MKRTIPVAAYPVIRGLSGAGCTHEELAEMFGCTRANITYIMARKVKLSPHGDLAIEAAVRQALIAHHRRRFQAVAKQLRELADKIESKSNVS